MFLNSKEYSSFWLNGKNYDKGYLNGKQIFGETLHAHTVKILARASAIGATPPTNIAQFDSYVRSMYQIWIDYCDVFFRFRGTGDVNFKRINLANPDGVLAYLYGGYTLDISGIKGNGINAYVDTNFNPSLLVAGQKYQLNDASRGVIIKDVASTTARNTIDGLSGIVATTNIMLGQNAKPQRINQAATNLSVSVDFSGTGLKILNRTSSSSVNGISQSTQTTASSTSSAIDNANQLILQRNGTFGDSAISSYFMGKNIPFATSQLIRTAENADMANLGLPQIA